MFVVHRQFLENINQVLTISIRSYKEGRQNKVQNIKLSHPQSTCTLEFCTYFLFLNNLGQEKADYLCLSFAL